MSSPTLKLTAAIIVGLGSMLSISPVKAAVQCPTGAPGHRLSLNDGGLLYYGSISDRALSAPGGTFQGSSGPVNTWTFKSAANLTLVCRYDGIASPIAIPIPPDTQTCRQDINGRSFVCQ